MKPDKKIIEEKKETDNLSIKEKLREKLKTQKMTKEEMEDFVLGELIDEGMKTPSVQEEEVFKIINEIKNGSGL